jgi:hypothetical protein
VHRVWREARLKPHRLERYMASNDPEFEAKERPTRMEASDANAQ